MRNAPHTRYTHHHGFTLIELLVVMSIISILVSIVLPNYKSYRAKAYDLRAELDLRSVAVSEEAYFLDTEQYLSCENDACALLPGMNRLSAGVTLQVDATPTGFTGSSLHAKGSGKRFNWDSSQGGFVQ